MNRKLSMVLQVAVGVLAAILLLFVITSIGLAGPLGTTLATIMTIIYAVPCAGCIWLIRFIRRKTRPIVSSELEKRKQKEPKNTTALKESGPGKRISSEQDAIAYISDGRTTRRADGKSLTDDDVEYLRETGFERVKWLQEQGANPKFHRSSDEEELSSRFFCQHSESLQDIEKSIWLPDLYSFDSVDAAIQHAQKALDSVQMLEAFCSQTKGGRLYFEDMWLHTHNSTDEDFSFIDKIKDRYTDLTSNYEERKHDFEVHKKRLAFSKVADDEVWNVIDKNPGILQKDIHKHFDLDLKPTIGTAISHLVKAGRISRIKCGNSFKLFAEK